MTRAEIMQVVKDAAAKLEVEDSRAGQLVCSVLLALEGALENECEGQLAAVVYRFIEWRLQALSAGNN